MGRRSRQLWLSLAACALGAAAAGCEPSCHERERSSMDAVGEVARDPVLSACDRDEECILVSVRIGCYESCPDSFPVRRDSVDLLAERLNDVNDEHCADFVEECGRPVAHFICLPLYAACVDGRCTARAP